MLLVFRCTLGAVVLAWGVVLLRPQHSDPNSSRSWLPPGWWTSPSGTVTAWPCRMVLISSFFHAQAFSLSVFYLSFLKLLCRWLTAGAALTETALQAVRDQRSMFEHRLNPCLCQPEFECYFADTVRFCVC